MMDEVRGIDKVGNSGARQVRMFRLERSAAAASVTAHRTGIVVVHLFCVEILVSARRHGPRDEDIDRALTHSGIWTELGEDPSRYLLRT